MSNITIKTKKEKTIVTNTFSYPQMLFERELKAPATMPCFLALTMKKKGKKTVLECIAQGLKAVEYYSNTAVTKAFFLSVVDQMVSIIINCKNFAINDTDIDLHYDRVFIDPQGRVKCILWPVTGEMDYVPKDVFFSQLTSVFRFDEREDVRFLNDYYAFFNSMQPFSINNFQKLIKKMMGKKSSSKSQPLDSDSSKPKPVPNSSASKSSIEYDPNKEAVYSDHNHSTQSEYATSNGTFFCSYCGKRLQLGVNFCPYCGGRLSVNPSVNYSESISSPETSKDNNSTDHNSNETAGVSYGTVVLGAKEQVGTVVLGFDEPETPSYPYLIREATQEKIMLDKPVFRIGCEKQYCDYFIYDNTYISRSHADIVTRGTRFFVVDKNSTNKTYVDGKVIPAETEVEVFPGTNIRLANENFTLHVE